MTSSTRRHFLMGAASLGWAAQLADAQAHSAAGPVDPPEAPPPVNLKLDGGNATTLQGLLKDRVTALQLMFTSCQATCPIQGALFGKTAKLLGDSNKPAQLLSVSIDPERDTPAVLSGWLKRFGASPRWRAAQPEKAQLEALVSFLKSKRPAPDPHTAQVYYFDRGGRLVLRSVDFPPAQDIVRLLSELAAKDGK